MKRITTWLIIISFTFVIGVMATLIYGGYFISLVQESDINNNEVFDLTVELPRLTYCELANHPEKYNDKIVRVKARLTSDRHGLLLMDKNCFDVESAAVIHNLQNSEEIGQNFIELGGSNIYREEYIDLITVGKFRKVIPSNTSDKVEDTKSFQFEIVYIEKVFKLR